MLLRTLGAAGALRLARFLALPARRVGHELFRGESSRTIKPEHVEAYNQALDVPTEILQVPSG